MNQTTVKPWKQHLYLCILHTVILSIFNLLHKIFKKIILHRSFAMHNFQMTSFPDCSHMFDITMQRYRIGNSKTTTFENLYEKHFSVKLMIGYITPINKCVWNAVIL